jgi:hypothetical protein
MLVLVLVLAWLLGPWVIKEKGSKHWLLAVPAVVICILCVKNPALGRVLGERLGALRR